MVIKVKHSIKSSEYNSPDERTLFSIRRFKKRKICFLAGNFTKLYFDCFLFNLYFILFFLYSFFVTLFSCTFPFFLSYFLFFPTPAGTLNILFLSLSFGTLVCVCVCVCAWEERDSDRWNVYVYVCVCVCVPGKPWCQHQSGLIR